MEMFAYSPEEASRQHNTRVRLIVIPFGFAVVLALFAMYFAIPGLTLQDYLPTVLVVLTIAAAIGYVKIRSAGKSAASLQIIIHADSISKTQSGTEMVQISRTQVKQIIHLPNSGIRVDSKVPGDHIYVPKEIENFSRIEFILTQWHPPTEGPGGLSPWVFVMLGFMILSAILLFIPATHMLGVALVGLVMVGMALALVVLGIRRFLVKRRLGEK